MNEEKHLKIKICFDFSIICLSLSGLVFLLSFDRGNKRESGENPGQAPLL